MQSVTVNVSSDFPADIGLEVTEHGQDARVVTVMGVRDEAKGEALVLLSSIDLDAQQMRAALREAEVPNLWVPRTIRRVEAIPVLASGKLDLGRCKQLAEA